MLHHLLPFLASQWLTLVLGLLIIHGLSVALAILSERREPAATLAWLMAVILLPGIGVLAYYILARTRFRRQFRKRLEANEQAGEALQMYVEQRLENFDESQMSGLRRSQRGLIALAANLAEPGCGGPPFPDTLVRLYADAADKFADLKQAIRSATSHIHLEYYIYRADQLGSEIRDLLADRARHGVDVRVLLDGVGCLGAIPPGFFDPLTDAGGQIATFLPIRFARILERMNFRNHRKIAVIDGHTGFLGGMNIGDEYLGKNPSLGHWHDAHLRIRGQAVAELQRIFLTDWLFATNQTAAGSRFFPDIPPPAPEPNEHTALVQIVSSGPDCHWPAIQQLYFQFIAGAARNVLIMTPYFVPDAGLLEALKIAALRGIDVQIMLPAHNNKSIVANAARAYHAELLEAGVRIFEFQDGFLHAKTLAIDSRYGSVGSVNMDVRSFNLNFEVTAIIHNKPFTHELEKLFHDSLTSSQEIALKDVMLRSHAQRLREALAKLLSGIL